MSMFRPGTSCQRLKDTNKTHHVIGDPLAVIYNEAWWRISSLSPLYNLQYNKVKLKQYASKIRQALVSTVAANSSTKYMVEFEEQVNLRYSDDDANALIINVTTSTHESTNKGKTVYSAILLSWGVSCSMETATHLPYMLERGEQKIGNAVKSTLQTIFDCIIHQFLFTQRQLLRFGFDFVEHDTSKDIEPFTLLYRTPQVDQKEKLKLSFELGDMKIIWNGIRDEVDKKSDLVTVGYKILQNQIFHMFMLDITVLDLCEVKLPKAEVKNNGSVKMKTPELVNCVFTVLNEISDIYAEKKLSNASDISNVSDNSVERFNGEVETLI